MTFAWLGVVSVVLSATSTVTCGDRWVAPPLDASTVHAWTFSARRGDKVVFETFPDSAWPRPVNVQAELIDASTGTRLAFNNDKAFGDLHARVQACIPTTGDYVARVGVPAGSLGGSYVGTLQCTPADRRHDDCADAGTLSCGTVFWESAGPCLTNDFDAGPGGCTGYASTGGDAVFGLRVEAGWSLEVTLQSTADAVLLLVADCANVAASCVAGADRTLAGEPEELRYRFDAAGRWFLILDHHGGGQGDLRLHGELDCRSVAVESIPWSQLRRLYRE
jgi:hypothetical protein